MEIVLVQKCQPVDAILWREEREGERGGEREGEGEGGKGELKRSP